jgi:galactokinase
VIDPVALFEEFRAGHAGARLYRAPGRINLIGEHTDYNDGFVMPMALDRATWVACAPRADRVVSMRSTTTAGEWTVHLEDLPSGRTGHWSDYVTGVAAVLSRDVRLQGADLVIASDVPAGAGLSSSAALEVSVGYALLDLSGAEIDLTRLALACQRAEHEFVGTRCGIMDQFVACRGRAGHALVLDTRDLVFDVVALPEHLRVLACNTMVAHSLASNEYNARRADCEAAVRILRDRFADVRSLRDVTLDQVTACADRLGDRLLRRCRHVISENARVREGSSALARADAAAFGELMYASHASLRDDYEVSCRELDVMVDSASTLRGVHGARMTGGGFGGSAVVVADADAVAAISTELAGRYETATGIRPEISMCAAGAGVNRVA